MTTKKNLIEVARELNALQTRYINSKWLHVKTNKIYIIENFVFDEHTQDIYVQYAKDDILINPNISFIRPFSEWEEQVDGHKRFERIKNFTISLTENETSNLEKILNRN